VLAGLLTAGCSTPPPPTYHPIRKGVLTVCTAAPDDLAGFDLGVASAVATSLKLTLRTIPTPAAAVLDSSAFTSGHCDASIGGLVASDALARTMLVSTGYLTEDLALLVPTSSSYGTLSDLDDHRVGIVRGSGADAILAANAPRATVRRYAGPAALRAALIRHRVDAVVVDLVSAVSISTAGSTAGSTSGRLDVVEKYPTSRQLAFGVAKHNLQMVRAINTAVAQYVVTPAYQALYQRYLSAR
jgi:ABC-type amino acid transport substrate-binding protein